MCFIIRNDQKCYFVKILEIHNSPVKCTLHLYVMLHSLYYIITDNCSITVV